MSSKNDDNAGLAIAIAIIGMMGLFVLTVLALFALVLTILSFCAWNKPLRLSESMTITPEEAHAFVWRGVAGAVLLPLVGGIMCAVLSAPLKDDAWLILIVIGYSLGSVGIGLMEAQEKEKAEQAARIIEMQRQAMPPAHPQKALPRPQAEPFRFASWDDEEEHGQ